MGSHDVCLGLNAPQIPSHFSLPDSLNAVKGSTVILLDGKVVSTRLRATPTMDAGYYYKPGQVHHVTVITAAQQPAWLLIDAGVGEFAALGSPEEAPADWRLQCANTRASFATTTPSNASSSTPNKQTSTHDSKKAANGTTSVEMLWTAPVAEGAVTLRVAAATSKGNISVVAAVLFPVVASSPTRTASTTSTSDDGGGLRYACTTSQPSNRRNSTGEVEHEWAVPQQQCQSVPPGTPGSLNKSACISTCLTSTPSTTGSVPATDSTGNRTAAAHAAPVLRCTRCAHVYDAVRDGNGLGT